MRAGHCVALASAHEEGVFAGFQIHIQSDFVYADAHMLCVEWMFFFRFDSGLSAGDSAKRTNLKFAVVTFLVETD